VDAENKLVQSFVGLRGRISNGRGTETDVTFSLYCYQVYDCGMPVEVLAEGLCRVSDRTNVLHELFHDGEIVSLSSVELEASIQLTSPGTFLVFGPIIKR
jgi:hypothetical protein